MQQLKPFQKAALEALEQESKNQENHVLCIAATGSGKSRIYETAAQNEGRRTVLITPLVALARQQHKNLNQAGVKTNLGTGGANEGPPKAKTGAWIVSPETLHNPKRKTQLQEWKPNFLVVDECHCIWEWGETFRPAFTEIPKLISTHKIKQSLWLTATLPYEAREQLRELVPTPLRELGQFELPKQLQLNVEQVAWPDRANLLLNWLHNRRGLEKDCGIVFVPTREATTRLARLIAATGLSVLTYHGGMSFEERKNAEGIVAQGIPDVILATSAFGMGMDYPHLRYVVVWQAPLTLLALVQTIGRVARNQNRLGQALVFWDPEDFRLIQWSVGDSQKRKREVEALRKFLETQQCRARTLKYYFDHNEENYSCMKCDRCCGGSQKAC